MISADPATPPAPVGPNRGVRLRLLIGTPGYVGAAFLISRGIQQHIHYARLHNQLSPEDQTEDILGGLAMDAGIALAEDGDLREPTPAERASEQKLARSLQRRANTGARVVAPGRLRL